MAEKSTAATKHRGSCRIFYREGVCTCAPTASRGVRIVLLPVWICAALVVLAFLWRTL